MKFNSLTTKNRLLALFCVFFVIFLLFRLYFTLTDDFRLKNITEPMPYEQTWNVFPSPAQEEELQQILKQKFIYFDKGSQSYAFSSEDDKYVLKFFKFKHLRPSKFQALLPSIGFIGHYKEKQKARKKRKLFGVYNAYKLAYDLDREESGLIYIQLNTTHNPHRTVLIENKIGYTYRIDLTAIPFILQYKGKVLRNVLTELLNRGDLILAERRINQILDLYANEYKKGIYDHDHGVMRNLGFVGEQPIHLDIGKLLQENSMKDKKVAKQDILIVVSKIKEWIEKKYPHYYQPLSESMDKKINELFE